MDARCKGVHSTDDNLISITLLVALTTVVVSKHAQRRRVNLSPLKGGGEATPATPIFPKSSLNPPVGDVVDGAMIAGVAEGVAEVDTEGAPKEKKAPPGAAGRVEGAEKEKVGVEVTTGARDGAGAGAGAMVGAGASGATGGIAATVGATGGPGSKPAARVNTDGADGCLKAVPAVDLASALEKSARLRISAANAT